MDPRPSPASVRPGDVLAGKYRVERVLGTGGMGTVVEATHLLLGGRVALKFLLGRVLEGGEARARFLREARVAARLRSPHVVTVHDVGELADGTPYIVMELLVGESLEAILEQERQLEPRRACELLLQGCEGLASAHAAGVIHRDIKPANLFVTRAEDGGARLKVLDFGISKILAPTAEASLTQTQATMGTPLYMAPEQMRSARSVDQRADVWALGAVLYRCLSARPAFAADSLLRVASLVLDADYPPLDQVAPRVPRPLAAIVHRCLASRPEDRFPDVASLAEALAPFAGQEGELGAARCRRILAAAEPMASSAAVAAGGAGMGETVPGLTGTAPTPSGGRVGAVLGRRGVIGLALALGVLALVGLGSLLAVGGGARDGRSASSAAAVESSAAAVEPRGTSAGLAPAEVPLVVPVMEPSALGMPVAAAPRPRASGRPAPPRAPGPLPTVTDPFADRK